MSLPDLLLDRAAVFIPVLLSLTVHEWAHAWTALKLGDDTAKLLGRVSLNPIDHIDPIGTLLVPLLGSMMGIPFGWAKPVPVNPIRFRTRMSVGVLLTAAAGPVSNLLLAVCGCAGLALLTSFTSVEMPNQTSTSAVGYKFLHFFVLVNFLLACFNLLPIPPLDGSRIVDAVMPAKLRPYWSRFGSISPVLLVAVILLPAFAGMSLFARPIQWVQQLLFWMTHG